MNISQVDFDNTVNQILSKSEYRSINNQLRNFINNLRYIIRNWIIDTLRNISWNIPFSAADNLSTIFIIVAILLLIAIIVLVIVTIIKGLDKDVRVKEILGEKITKETTSLTFKNKAEELQKKGRYREAIRYDFIAILLLMHEKRILYLDKAKTNKEIYLYLKKNPFTQIKKFGELIDIFNISWYGHKLCQLENYETWNKKFNHLWSVVISYEKEH